MPQYALSTLFERLPIGAYRSTPAGEQLLANLALARINGYASVEEMLSSGDEFENQWYVKPGRRGEFRELIERDGFVVNFVSEIHRNKTRERIWIREDAHMVRDENGKPLFYEGTVQEITDTVAMQQAAARNEAMLRQLTSAIPGMVYRIRIGQDGTMQYEFVSDGLRELYGMEPQTLMQNPRAQQPYVHPQDAAGLEAAYARALRDQSDFNREFRIRLPQHGERWIHQRSVVIERGPDYQIRCGIMTDVTALHTASAAVQASEERMRLALDASGDGVWDWDLASGVETFSQRFLDLYGYTQKELDDDPEIIDNLTHPDDRAGLIAAREAHFSGRTESYRNEHRVRTRQGEWKWILTRGLVVSRDASGKPVRMVGTHTDISERKAAEAQVWKQARFDSLTGLLNRTSLRAELESRLASDLSDATAVLFIDLDHFKEVNDTLGHNAGDLLLLQVARRIQDGLGHDAMVGRMGGDEFTVVLGDLGADTHDNIAAAGIRESLQRRVQGLLDSLAQAFELDSEQVFVSASVGIALAPFDGATVEDLFKHADQSLYEAKAAGRNCLRFFTPDLRDAALRRSRLVADLRCALERQELEVVYQPIVALDSGTILKVEALLRWHHPALGDVSPAEFIPIAESTGLILSIGNWVFRQALMQVQHWRHLFGPDFQVSVNKSPVQIHHAISSAEGWAEALMQGGHCGSSIAVEITEGLLLESSTAVSAHLQALRAAGFQVSLDDFGTGFSSLTYLQRLNLDVLKIDRAFMQNLQARSKDLALCEAIITMAHALGMKVVAEGVETQQQATLLASAGCDYAQGYFYARPMSVPVFEDWMRQRAMVPADSGNVVP